MSNPQIIEITDSTGKAKAEIIASLGFNCFHLELSSGEETVDVLWSSDDFRTGNVRPSRCGIPILFPFPGRIANASFHWEGRDFDLEPSDGLGNAIHGFVHTRPWTISRHESDSVVAVFDAENFADELRHRWPTMFRLQAEYRISSDRLDTAYTVVNPTDAPLPFGLGLHPYFHVGPAESKERRITVHSPVGRQWTLKNLIPSGQSEVLSDDYPLNQGQPFDSMEYDDVFSDLPCTGEQIESSFIDHRRSIKTTITSDASFTVSVIYTPPHREAFCIEPYTCLPNPFDEHQQKAGLGVAVLAPGETRVFRVSYRVENLE